jgi:hypothetical protein
VSIENPIASLLEHIADQHTNWLFVVDHKHSSPYACSRVWLSSSMSFKSASPAKRGKYRQIPPLAEFGIDANLASGLPNEFMDHGQTQSRPLSERLGGIEWFECPLDDLRRHAGPGVADTQRDVLARREAALFGCADVQPFVGGLDGDPPAVRGR